jgi:hypothetical protein
MTADASSPEGLSLKRWSRRKLEAAREKAAAAGPDAQASPAPQASPPAAPPPADAGAAMVVSAPVAGSAPAIGSAQAVPARSASVVDLPPVETLTIDSDFAPFFQPKVGETLKRQALKQLFRDPHFNVMDGLDTYIGDYSIPDPISADVVRQMVQGRYIFDPPATRIGAQGHVEDVPPEEAVPGPPADPAATAATRPPLPAPAATAGERAPSAPAETASGPAIPPDPGTPDPPAR